MAGTSLGTAYVQIMPSAKGISKSIENELSGGGGGGIGSAAGSLIGGNLVKGIMKVVAAAGITTGIKKALDAGGALQQSFGGLDTIYGDAAEAAKEYSKQAAAAGISMNSYAEQAVSFGASLKQAYGGDTAKAVEAANTAILDMADNSAKMGTDLSMIQNAYQGFAKQNYTMLDNLKLGYGGTKTEMQRLLADATKLSGVKYDMDNLGDVYEAIHVIQGSLGLTGVAAGEAETTFTGSMGAMKAAAENFMASLAMGEDVLPSLKQLGGNAMVFVKKNLLPMVGNIVKALPGALDGITEMVVDMINGIGKDDSVLGSITDTVGALAMSVVNNAPKLLEAVMRLVRRIGNMLKNYDWGRLAQDALTSLKKAFSDAGELFGGDGENMGIIASLVKMIGDAAPELLSAGMDLLEWLVQGFVAALPGALEATGQFVTGIINYIGATLPGILQKGVEIVVNLAEGILQAAPDLVLKAGEVISSVLATLQANLPSFLEAGRNIISKISEGIRALGQSIPAILTSIATTAKNVVTSIDWVQLGKDVVAFIADGVLNLGFALWDAISGIAEWAFKTFKETDWVQLGKDVINFIVEGVQALFFEIPERLYQIAGEAMRLVDDQGGWIEVGKNIINGIINGITAIGGEIWKSIKGFVGGAIEGAKELLGIASPSKVFRDEVGKMIPLGIAAGIEGEADAVQTAMDDIARSAVSDFDTSVVMTGGFRTAQAATQSGTVYNIGDVTLDVKDLKDVLTLEDFVARIKRAKRLGVVNG